LQKHVSFDYFLNIVLMNKPFYIHTQDGYITMDETTTAATLANLLLETATNAATISNLWMMLATALVFIMHLGFASLESGLTQAKNATNILFKNLFVICMGILTYYIIGFELMYPGSGIALLGGPDAHSPPLAYANGAYTYYTDFLFQAMFAATTATIVSGAVAERIKLPAFMLFATVFVAFVYPFLGEWKWGGGWLDQLGFYDFAGSTLVHGVGGAAAFMGAWMLGPRLGKYTKEGLPNVLPASNLPLAMIGGMLLWLGWFGFNGGSVLSADPLTTSIVLVTTCLSAAAGGVTAMFISCFQTSGKPDFTMALNGVLAGLVGITAGADVIAPGAALVVGSIAGIIVVASVITLDQVLKIDDPVGAISVHMTCGIWGTLAVGIFSAQHSFLIQLAGTSSIIFASALASYIIFKTIDKFYGIRVSIEEEEIGLDLAEHGMVAYSNNPTYNK
jgi:Amt family ammonium transporter